MMNWEMHRQNVLLFASGKGGVGKSTLSAALAMALARAGRRCLLIDGDVGLRSLDIMLGMQDKMLYELADCIARRCSIDQAIAVHPHQPLLHVAAAGQEVRPKDFPEKDLLKVMKTLKVRYDYVLIDGPAGIGRGLRNFMGIAGRVVLVATPDDVCLRDAEKTARLIREAGGGAIELLINRYDDVLGAVNLVMEPQVIAQSLDLSLLGVVGQCDCAYTGMLRGKTLADAGDRRTRAAIDRIAGRITGQVVPFSYGRRRIINRLRALLREDI